MKVESVHKIFYWFQAFQSTKVKNIYIGNSVYVQLWTSVEEKIKYEH